MYCSILCYHTKSVLIFRDVAGRRAAKLCFELAFHHHEHDVCNDSSLKRVIPLCWKHQYPAGARQFTLIVKK